MSDYAGDVDASWNYSGPINRDIVLDVAEPDIEWWRQGEGVWGDDVAVVDVCRMRAGV